MLVLTEFFDSGCLNVPNLSNLDKDFEFYHSVTTAAAAALVYSLYPEGYSFCEVYKLLVHEIAKDKYSFITEYDIILLLNYYYQQCAEGILLYTSPLYLCYDEEQDDEEQDDENQDDDKQDDEKQTDTIFNDIKEVVDNMGCFRIAKVDDRLHPLQDHLKIVAEPLYLLCDTTTLELSPEVCEVIQVAEIRRIALDSRFISQKHLMWAFYECGYGLPANLEATFNSDDDHHPPYHIYVASVKLAMLFGEKVVQLQHFVFAILRWELIGDGEEMIKMGEDFRAYMKVLDSIKKTKAPSEGITKNDVEEVGRDDVS